MRVFDSDQEVGAAVLLSACSSDQEVLTAGTTQRGCAANGHLQCLGGPVGLGCGVGAHWVAYRRPAFTTRTTKACTHALGQLYNQPYACRWDTSTPTKTEWTMCSSTIPPSMRLAVSVSLLPSWRPVELAAYKLLCQLPGMLCGAAGWCVSATLLVHLPAYPN